MRPMKKLIALALLAAAAAACRKVPKYDENKSSQTAPAPQHVDANPLNGAALIQKAQSTSGAANGAVKQEEKTDVPAQ